MKSVSFQRNKSLIRVVNEEKIRKSRNWDRIIYLILLAVFLFFVVYYVVHKSLYVHANGQVLLEGINIRLTDDVRILDFYVAEGDSVQRNDTLFAYAKDEDKNGGAGSGGTAISISTGGGEPDTWWWKEKYNLQKKIAMNNIEIARNNELIQSYQGEMKRLTNEVILDVMPKARLDLVKGEIVKLITENQKFGSENAQLAAMMGQLAPSPVNPFNSEIKLHGSGSNSTGGTAGSTGSVKYNFSGESLSEPRYFTSPIDGIITRLYMHEFETALKAEQIMAMHKNYTLTIKSFFDQEDLDQLKEGDVFKIVFPDGTESLGVLKRFYFATYSMPEEFQKKYEPTTRAISADIFPLNDEEGKKWKAFYKMSVEISKFKY